MRGYPRTLHEQSELAPYLAPGEPATPGADELRQSLFTMPTQSRVAGTDLLDLERWAYHVAAGPGARSSGYDALSVEDALCRSSSR